MATIRATFFFTQQGYGWTESYWTTANTINEASLLAKGDRLGNARIKMCGAECVDLRSLQREGIFRDAARMCLTTPAALAARSPNKATRRLPRCSATCAMKSAALTATFIFADVGTAL